MSSAIIAVRDLLVRRLTSHRLISTAERDRLAELTWRVEEMPPRHSFIREGDLPAQSCLVVSGVLARTQYTAHGQRQILSVHIAGDMPDLQSLHVGRMDHDLETVSAAHVAFVSHADLHRLCAASYQLGAAFWRESLIDAALHRAAIFRNAQLEAEARLGHFLCEMHLRHAAVGVVGDTGFDFPLSQELMGEVLGLTNVSINKAAQSLRTRELIHMQKGLVQVLDFKELARFSQFDGTFLHLRDDDPMLAVAS